MDDRTATFYQSPYSKYFQYRYSKFCTTNSIDEVITLLYGKRTLIFFLYPSKALLFNVIQIVMISKHKVMLCDRYLDLIQNVIYDCSIPEQLLFLEVVYQKGFILVYVFPGHKVGKAVGVEADQGIDYWPGLYQEIVLLTSGCLGTTTSTISRFRGIAVQTVSISWVWTRLFSSWRRLPRLPCSFCA